MGNEPKKKRRRKPLKKANGHGSVYKASGRRRKPWVARITVGWTPDGKQKRQILGYFEKKKDAENALLKHRISPVSPKANITLGELYEEWSESKFEYISRSTVYNYQAAWKHLSRYKDVKFKEIRTAHLQSIIDKCLREKSSRSTMEKIKGLAYMLYSYAMENDIVNKNYAEFIKLPKVEKEERKIFSELDIKKMFDNADSVEWVDTILILIYTGMRISEMLELTKFDVDLENGIIIGGLKTDAGKNRIIPIHPKILKYVKRWYNKNGERLICKEDGKKMSAKYYREKKYYPALDALEIKRLVPHSCRHTFASMMAKAGADTLAIQRIIGHADYATTANIYTHESVEELKKAINKI